MRETDFQSSLAGIVAEPGGSRQDLSGQVRQVRGVLQPRSTREVVRVVSAARRFKAKLHPFSCGKNWGFGSSLPTGEAWLLDLSLMNRCHTYDAATGTITIEPGVTQQGLYELLANQGGEWFFNITGAGSSTSVLGNALERGIGYYGQRHLDLIDLTVVTGTGDIVTSRLLGEQMSSCAPLGLDLTSIFLQSGLGIVVSARLRLLKRSEGGGGAVLCRLKNEKDREELFRRVIDLKREGCIGGVPHIGNRARIVSTMAPWLDEPQQSQLAQKSPSWTAALPLTGCRTMTQAAAAEIGDRLESICDLQVLPANLPRAEELKNPSSPFQQLAQLASGFPSNLALPGVEWAALSKATPGNLDPENTSAGLIHVTPSLPGTPWAIENALGTIKAAEQALGFGELALTVNLVDAHFAVAVISLPFKRSSRARASAQARKFEKLLFANGLRPYRIGLGQEAWLGTPSQAAVRLFQELKGVLDPSDILACSKYDRPYVEGCAREAFHEATEIQDANLLEAA